MPHPRAGDMPGLARAGVTRVVSLLPTADAAALGLAGEGDWAAAAGRSFHRTAIPDFGTLPLADFAALSRDISGWIEAGEGVAIHCRAGIGRSGMVASGVLVALGDEAEAAMDRVSAARGMRVPETAAQRQLVVEFSRPG